MGRSTTLNFGSASTLTGPDFFYLYLRRGKSYILPNARLEFQTFGNVAVTKQKMDVTSRMEDKRLEKKRMLYCNGKDRC